MPPRPSRSTPFPYTTLFRSIAIGGLFLLTLLIVSLFTIKISDLVLDSRVGALDRSLGFLFGLARGLDRKSTRLNSSHSQISYAVFCLKKKKNHKTTRLNYSH